MNLIPAVVRDRTLVVGDQPVARVDLADGTVVAGVRPSHLRIGQEGIPGTILLSENLGESMLVNVDAAGEILKVRLSAVQPLRDGETVRLSPDPAHIHLFDTETRRRLPEGALALEPST